MGIDRFTPRHVPKSAKQQPSAIEPVPKLDASNFTPLPKPTKAEAKQAFENLFLDLK